MIIIRSGDTTLGERWKSIRIEGRARVSERERGEFLLGLMSDFVLPSYNLFCMRFACCALRANVERTEQVSGVNERPNE